MPVLEFPDTELEPFPLDGMIVPAIRRTLEEQAPSANVKVGGEAYLYDRSYPIKGYSAVLPAYLREQMDAGKRPLLVERPDRVYVYFAV